MDLLDYVFVVGFGGLSIFIMVSFMAFFGLPVWLGFASGGGLMIMSMLRIQVKGRKNESY